MEVAAAAAFPTGYHFAPTDGEAIDILARKVNNKPIPTDALIREVDISRETPMALSQTHPKLGVKEWYFFAEFDRKYRNGKRPDRRCGASGVLKASQGDKKIYSAAGQLVGFRKKLIFCEERRRKLENTDWKIDEYRLNRPPGDGLKLDWVLIRIYQRKYSLRNHDPSVPENSTATMENAGNVEVLDHRINEGDDDHPGVNNNSSNTYNALMHNIPKFDGDIDFSGINGEGVAMVPVVPDNAFYYDAPPPQLFDSNLPYIDFGNLVDDLPVPVVNNTTTDNALRMPQQQIYFPDFGRPAINFNTPFATNTTNYPLNRQAMDDPGVPAVNTSTTEYNSLQQIYSTGFDFPAIDFNTPFATNTTTDSRNGDTIEFADDHPGVPAINTSTTEYNSLQQIYSPGFDFPAIDFNTPFATNTTTDINARKGVAFEIVDDHPGVPVVNSSTTEYNALHNRAPAAFDFSAAVNSDISSPTNTTTDDAGNREAAATVDDAVLVNMPQQINFGDFDIPEINFDIDFQDIDFSAGDFGIPFPDHIEH